MVRRIPPPSNSSAPSRPQRTAPVRRSNADVQQPSGLGRSRNVPSPYVLEGSWYVIPGAEFGSNVDGVLHKRWWGQEGRLEATNCFIGTGGLRRELLVPEGLCDVVERLVAGQQMILEFHSEIPNIGGERYGEPRGSGRWLLSLPVFRRVYIGMTNHSGIQGQAHYFKLNESQRTKGEDALILLATRGSLVFDYIG